MTDESSVTRLLAVAGSVLVVLSVVAVLGMLPTAASDYGIGDPITNDDTTSEASVSLNQTIYSEDRGDVVAIGVELSNTDTATVTIGTTGDNNWAQNVTVRDGDRDGFVALEFNTYTAGTSDDTYAGGTGYVVYSTADSADGVTNVAPSNGSFDPDSPADDTLAVADYAIAAVTGTAPASETADGEDAVATLALSERSTDAVTTYVAPDARLGDLDGVSAVSDLLDNGNVTEAAEIADGDVLLTKIDASGLEGVLKNRTDGASANDTAAFFAEARGDGVGDAGSAWAFRIDQANSGANASSATLNASNTEFLADGNNDDYWLVTDTDGVSEFADGDELETNFTTLDVDDVNPDDATVLDTWAFAAPEATVDTNADTDGDGDVDEVTVQKAAGQEITGVTNVAPGTELFVRVTGTDVGSPFVKPLTAIVEPDGSWTARADFSGNAQGANFSVDVRRGNERLLDDGVDGRIAAAPTASVTFNDQESFGTVVTVASVTTSDGGFVAIHLNNASGTVIGASDYLEPGSHSGIDVTLDRPLGEDARLVAMPHQDTDGDRAYEFEFGSAVDAPYTENGSAVTDGASITVTSPVVTTTGIMTTEDPIITTEMPIVTTEEPIVTTDMPIVTTGIMTTAPLTTTGDHPTTDASDTAPTTAVVTTVDSPGFGVVLTLVVLALVQLLAVLREGSD